jgi:hypothetical protein
VKSRARPPAAAARYDAFMSVTGPTLQQLRGMVGAELRYQGMRCILVDVLDEPPVLVLRPVDAAPVIQADNFGKPMRHAPQLFELPVFGADGRSLSPELQLISAPGDPGITTG